ncbi:MAG: LLM class flavin-dependent oxidoreductase [Candidatus Rokuibacteriota bacterium]
MTATLGINLMAVDPPDRFVEVARFVESAGFSHMLVADSSLHARDVYPYLTLLATHTSSIRIGPSVIHPYTRHPAVNANALATVNEIANGRVIVNIGAGDRPVMELGYPIARLTVVREAVAVIRLLLAGQPASFAGETFRLHDAALRFGRRDRMPVYVTASGPRMLELAGEVADGVLFLAGSDPRCVRFALDRIAAGVARSGRRLSDLVLGCNIYGALEDDRAAAMDACRAIAAWFPQTAPHYAELIGVPKDRVDAIRRAYAGGHFDEARGALDLVTDDMVEAFALAGNTGVWIERLEAIQSMGVNLFVIYPMVADKLGTIRRIAAEILPRFRR